MKKKYLLLSFLAVITIITSAYIYSDNGRAGKTGSPTESTCVQCHSNSPLNTGTGSISITSNIPNWKYAVGQTYQITVTVSQPGITLFGLGVEALKSNNTNAGMLMITNSAETQLKTATNGRVNVVHQFDGGLVTTPGSKSFSFEWISPVADSGAVTFYVSGIAADADGSQSGDDAYATSQVVNSPSSTVGISKVASALNFSVYPNPVRDVLNISINSLETGKVTASLYSMVGAKVADLFESNNYFGIEKHISVPNAWAKGTYLLEVRQNGKTSIQRVVFQ